jgi:hypothetical protein
LSKEFIKINDKNNLSRMEERGGKFVLLFVE